MNAKVTEEGVLIPREMLDGLEEVTIIKQEGMIIIVPAREEDPIFEFGKHPVKAGVTDASENLDKYLYGSL